MVLVTCLDIVFGALLTGLCFISRYALDMYKNKLNTTHNCELNLYNVNSI